MHSKANKPKRWSLEQRKVYCRARKGDGWLKNQTPELPKGFQKIIFKSQVREGGLRVRGQLVHKSLIG